MRTCTFIAMAALLGLAAMAAETAPAGEFGFNWLPAREDGARGAGFDVYFAKDSRRGRALAASGGPSRIGAGGNGEAPPAPADKPESNTDEPAIPERRKSGGGLTEALRIRVRDNDRR